ncbi:MAG: universal stress protein, UspA [Gammaproteobacteria bacterium]|nr:MAG: universal stress protein, UspA [Gammaproteobacteria bacterium]
MQRFKNILCVVSTEQKDNPALEHAVKLAENNQASLSVVEVIDKIPANTRLLERTLSLGDIQATIVTEHQKILSEMVSSLNSNIRITSKVLTGISFLEVIYEVLRNGHDLVFKVADNNGLLGRLFGSDDMHILRKCPCPVWLVRPHASKPHQRILAAVDVDDNYPSGELNTRQQLNHQILELATSLAISESAKLDVVHVWDAIGEGYMRYGLGKQPEHEVDAYVEDVKQLQNLNMNRLMSQITNTLGQDALEYIKPETHLVRGHALTNVPEFAAEINADLVVMGTVARTGLSGFFMGNTAESILNQLDCSVLAVKPAGFVSPVTLNA